MSRLTQLLPASFKGISFFVRDEVMTEGGRRVILHDYPNSSQRYVEDLGQLPQKFTVTAFVTGDDFLNRAGQLEKALQEQGPGKLSMPTFGILTVYAMPYRKDASQRDIGEIRFELAFTLGKSISGPSRTSNTQETVYQLGDEARQAVGNALESAWIEPAQSSNALVSQYDLEQATKANESLLTAVDNVSDIETIVNFVKLNGPTIIRTASFLREIFVDGLWQDTSIGLSSGAGLSTLLGLTRFGTKLTLSLAEIRSADIAGTSAEATATEIPLWPETTGGRVTRNKNRLTLINTARICALISSYEQAAARSYQTDSEIDETRIYLENEHERLMRIDTENRDLIQSESAVRRAVENLRLAALNVLDDKDQSTYTLTEFYLNAPASSFVLSYTLYAEDFTTAEEVNDRAIILRGLNQDQAADKLTGTVTVLQK